MGGGEGDSAGFKGWKERFGFSVLAGRCKEGCSGKEGVGKGLSLMRVGRGECLSEGGTGMSGEGRSKLIIDLESFLNFVFNLLLCFFSFLMMMSEEVSEPAEQGSVSVHEVSTTEGTGGVLYSLLTGLPFIMKFRLFKTGLCVTMLILMMELS